MILSYAKKKKRNNNNVTDVAVKSSLYKTDIYVCIRPDISLWFELLYQIQRWPDISFFELPLVAFAGWG